MMIKGILKVEVSANIKMNFSGLRILIMTSRLHVSGLTISSSKNVT